ncbi:MAG: Gfo/Idh/MocA family oxidoreductase [Methylacidiphilales bacterium]|nr:Gfo/Idh/MocA family oxidoreductase [Candidatus Methylacidiphilales bacterium]
MKRIRIAIVGLNFGGHIIERLLQDPGRKYFQIAAVCDLDKAKAVAMGKRLKCEVYTDLDALLANREIPAIGLYTGPAGRAGLLRRIIRAGKDVMTTKPFEVDPKAALDVLREARRRKRIIHLNSPSPVLSPDLEQIARWRDEFRLGRPIGARADAWANYREKADGSWYDNPKHCPLAPVFRIGIYHINDLVRFFGEPRAVQVFHSRLSTGRPTPDNAQLGIQFKNGGLVNIFSSFCVDDFQHYRNSLTINFERGTVYRNAGPFPNTPETWEAVELEMVTHRKGKPVVRRKKMANALSGTYQWEVFYRALRGAKLSNATTPEEIVAGLRIVSAMARAEKSGYTEKV